MPYKKTRFLPMRKQRSRSVTAQLISAFVFAARIVQFLLYLYPKFQDSSFLLWVYRSVCVGPAWKSRRPILAHHQYKACHTIKQQVAACIRKQRYVMRKSLVVSRGKRVRCWTVRATRVGRHHSTMSSHAQRSS